MFPTVCDVARRLSLRQVIRAEYLDMPGLNLTLAQASRLWKADAEVCRDALETLVDSGFLMKAGARYHRADYARRDGRWTWVPPEAPRHAERRAGR